MSWDERAQAYRESETHRSGADLAAVTAWCDPGPGVTALDVATGGGHVADRLRALGCEVTTCDAAAGMQPDVVCPAEALAFADSSFAVVACRIAAHHFEDAERAVAEMARVTRGLVVIEDTLFTDDRVEQAERLRDPTHVRSYTEQEWRAFLAAAGLRVTDSAVFEKHHPLEPWLTRTGCTGDAAARVRAMLAPWTRDGVFCDRKIGFRSARE